MKNLLADLEILQLIDEPGEIIKTIKNGHPLKTFQISLRLRLHCPLVFKIKSLIVSR
jgi:hypothetical protein